MMELNTEFNDLLGCPLSFHKLQLCQLGSSVEAIEFGQKHPN